ncbi:hypothetical protein HS088_TW13G00028 [Tripterygium wilfordii]|uniref:F-box domain-containing protein n=1 Tax=Tripterygium wilfordii TaxID=458696 RepID=A0A7J7CST6_TRIWF|nr:hypothetical protein HS088_TW13G00028 [Tripterygium wilfordii]
MVSASATERERERVEEDRRYWSDLPYDLLMCIAKKLPLDDHLSFRWVCKDWYSVSKIYCQLNIPESLTESLWLIFSTKGRGRRRRWKIGDPRSGRTYFINDPLICARKSRCLVSKHGWLLLLVFSSGPSPSLCFFNPLSRARIDLPWCDTFSGLNWVDRKDPVLPVFAISSPPTSPDCIVWSIRMFSRGYEYYETSMIERGESVWKTKISETKGVIGPILHALFYKGIFYWKTRQSTLPLPPHYSNSSWEAKKDRFAVKVFTDQALNCIFSPEECEKIITIPPEKEVGRKLGEKAHFWADGMPVGACCASVEDGSKFVGWHFWDKRSCPHTCGNPRGKCIWIEPRWTPPSQDLKW